jgi:GGDEF domain-containing protein
MNRVFRKLNLQIAPILLFPLLMTSLTGIIIGLGNRSGIFPPVLIDALLLIHQGGVLGQKLIPFYVLFLGLGVLAIGLNILIKVRESLLSRSVKPSRARVNLYKIVALILVFPLGVCIQTGVAIRLGTDWLGMTSQQTAIFESMHTGTQLPMMIGTCYTLVTGFGLILLSIVGIETDLVNKVPWSGNQTHPSLTPVEQTSKFSLPLLDNISLLRAKVRNAIIIFSLIFFVILSLAMSAIWLPMIIVGVVFTFPAWFIAERLIQDWRQQQETQANFYDPESESATILRAIPDSMLRISDQGICLSYIPAKEPNSFAITGEIINKHINEFLEPKIALKFIKSAQWSLKTGETVINRFPLLLNNGRQQYYEARISAIGMSEVLIMIRQLPDLNPPVDVEEQSPKFSSEETILLLSEPELEVILELSLNQASINNSQHILCCLVIDDLAIDFEPKFDSGSQQDSRISEILMYQIAAKIKTHFASSYTACINDNEFLTLVLDCSSEDASRLINQLRKDLNNFLFQWQGNKYPIKTSIGLLEIKGDNSNATDLINIAKATCNIAKQKVEVKTFW